MCCALPIALDVIGCGVTVSLVCIDSDDDCWVQEWHPTEPRVRHERTEARFGHEAAQDVIVRLARVTECPQLVADLGVDRDCGMTHYGY